MERFKGITIIFVLAFAVLASAAQAKTASVLLQEGLYAEQIEGNLEAAIRIYRQVIHESKEMQQTAAHATYRIAICYLKRGEKAEAARELRTLLSKFPQQQSLIKEAQKQLAKLEPLAGFGPVIERLVNDDGVGEDFLLDLDTGRLYSASDAKEWSETSGAGQEKSLEDFIMESGVDLFGETSKKSLMGIDMIAMPTHNERWNMSPEDVIEQVSLGKPGTPVALSADGELPKNFVFKTGQGGMGILQITEMQDGKAPRHFKIRYKMLQEAEKTARTEVLGPVIERVIYSEATGKPFFFDLDTGQAFYPPAGLTRYSPEREVLEWSATKGIDFVNSRGHLELVERTSVKVESDMWESATPAEIKDALLKGSTQNFLPTRSKDYTISSPITYVFKTREGGIGILQILEKKDNNLRIRYKMLQKEKAKSPIDLSTPEATIKSFVNAVYNGNLEAAKACVSKEGHDYDEFMEMLATESNHPFQAMIKAMDGSIPIEITSKDITEDRCKIKWYFTLGRVYYFGETKMKKGTHQEFSSYLEFVGDKWLIRDI